MGSGPLRRFRLAYDVSELFRRYFISTLFDSTFVALGVVSATALVPTPNLTLALSTLAATCVAVGISTGVGVYEAERLEGEIRIRKMEHAMLSDMRDTDMHRGMRAFRLFVSLVNLSVPLIVLGIVSTPLLTSRLWGTPDARTAAVVAVVLAIAIVFVAGSLLGRLAERNVLQEGLRMTVAALGTFVLLLAIQMWVL